MADNSQAPALMDHANAMAGRKWTLIAVGVGVFMLLLDLTIVNVALPSIQRQLHGSLSDLQWVIDAYALSLGALMLTAGSLADLLGRKRVWISGVVVFTAGSALCGAAQSPLFLTLARAGQGIGGAIMFATSLALVAQAYHGKDRGVAFAVIGGITGVASAIGPVIGGAITSGLSWRWIFFVNLPIGIVLLALSVTRLHESRDPDANRPDWIGFLTFSSGLGLLVYGLIESSSHPWGSGRVAGSLVACGILMLAFLAAELIQRQPMFDMSLLRNPSFDGGLVAAFAISASAMSLLTFLVLYLQNVLGYSAFQTGLRLLVLSGATLLTAGAAGRLTSTVPTRLLIAPGFALVGVGLLLMRGITGATGWTHLLPGLIVVGLGSGMLNTPLANLAVSVVEPRRAGMASGINSTFRQIGIAGGVAALGSIFASKIRDQVTAGLAGTPAASHAAQLATAVSTGHIGPVLAHVPASSRGHIQQLATSSFTGALDDILLIAGIVAFAGAVLALGLIRQKDFIELPAQTGEASWAEAVPAPDGHPLHSSAPRTSASSPGF